MSTPFKSPQVAAVQQTLAGERMTQTVSFPTTGDADCDFIQGILAVGKALDVHPALAVRVLGYMLERWKHEQDNLKQPVNLPGQLDCATTEAIHRAVRQAIYDQQVYSGLRQYNSGGTAAPQTIPQMLQQYRAGAANIKP